MKARFLFATMLLLVAGIQTTMAQGFRVYKSDGTVVQFSFRTDSIVFYDGIGSDAEFGPFTPVNQMITGTWYKSRTESVSFNEDGTTDYQDGASYEFLPYQGTLIINDAEGRLVKLLRVPKVTKEYIVLSEWGGDTFSVLTATQPSQLVTSITLSETSFTLQPDESKRLTATVLPADADNPSVTWTSSNDAVAEVNGTGRVTANGKGTCTVTATATDGSGVKATCEVTVTSDSDEHEWVDLGLPSGTLWATCNVGASKPEEYGSYFAWGETEPKDNYDWSTYKWCRSSKNTMTKYCTDYGYNGFTDGKTELDAADDAATANWGSGWQMPSRAQIEELYNSSYTTTEWTQENGVNGRRITSKSNGKTLFLPAAGDRDDTGLYDAGSRGYYWSRSLYAGNSNYAYFLYFRSNYFDWSYYDRNDGQSVRPVRK